MTYEKCFEFGNKYIPENEIICITNLDIFIEHSNAWKNLTPQFFTDKFEKALTISRYEYDMKTGSTYLCKSQLLGSSADGWIYLNKPNFKLNDCNFVIGSYGCDGSII